MMIEMMENGDGTCTRKKNQYSFLEAERNFCPFMKKWSPLPLVGKSGYAEKPHVCRGLLFISSQVILDAVHSSMSFVLVKLFVW